jgi:hypothetical protein
LKEGRTDIEGRKEGYRKKEGRTWRDRRKGRRKEGRILRDGIKDGY